MTAPLRSTASPHPFLPTCLLALLALLAGCERPAEQAAPPNSVTSHSGAVMTQREHWDVFYISGTKVGFGRTQFEYTPDGNFTISAEHSMEMQRFRQTVKQKIAISSTLDLSGRLLKCSSKVEAGTQPLTTMGRVEGEQLHLTTNSQGNELESTLKWNEQWGGYFAADLSLLERPMQPGETRMIKSLAAIFNQVATTELTASKWEETSMLHGEEKLLRIEQRTTLGKQTIPSTAWMSPSGETRKVFVPGIRQTTYRVSKDEALQRDSSGTFDLAEMTIVKVAQRFAEPHRTREVVYRARLAEGDPTKVFSQGTSQQVEAIDSHTAKITVLGVRPDRPAEPSPLDEPPSAADLAPNTLIQANDPRIVAMAGSVQPNEVASWKLALALEGYVKRAVTSKNFSQAFATAAEVAESLEGDCTEHAVLLAALCRAREIPARVAIGLVYFPQAGGFAYHMWTEVWITDRWIPLDATLGYGGIGGAHLKIAHSNLAGAEAYSVFLPAQQVIGQLELEVLSVEE